MTDPLAVTRDELLAQIVPDYRRWIFAVARDLCGPRYASYHNDVAQEGYIAMWRAVGSFDPDRGAAAAWLTKAATMRMADVVRRGFRTWTGHEAMRGARPVDEVASVEVLAEEKGFDVEDVLAAAAIEDVSWGYHTGEIAEALAALTATQREYVYARFWLGMTGPELDAAFGNGSRNYWYAARPKLQERLAHLV